jgi:catechol 2,3-dioxygenase-like lactoylglutathione lyase family enzyme
MITAVHTLIYGEDAAAARTFFRDVLQLPGTDTGGGWLIFKTGPSELGLHPSRWEYGGESGGTDQRFDVSLMCDDLSATVEELKGRGAEFDDEVVEQQWGHTITMHVPGAGSLTLFEPTYDPPATSL